MRGTSAAILAACVVALLGVATVALVLWPDDQLAGQGSPTVAISDIPSNSSVRPPGSPLRTMNVPPSQVDQSPSGSWVYIALVILSIAVIVATATSFYLYRWRKILLDKPHYLVPEEWGKWVNNLESHLQKLTSAIGESVKFTSHHSQATNKTVSELSETFMTLQSALDERDAEIRRFKQGYDAEIFRKFVYRFIRVDQLVDDLMKSESLNVSDLQHVQRLLDDAFEECGVESFRPELGSDYRDAFGVADNPKRVSAETPEDDFKILEVIEAGYQIRNQEVREVIVPAKVRIQTYQ